MPYLKLKMDSLKPTWAVILLKNESDFQDIKLRQRVAVDITERSVTSEMIGQPVTMPVALAPGCGRSRAGPIPSRL